MVTSAVVYDNKLTPVSRNFLIPISLSCGAFIILLQFRPCVSQVTIVHLLALLHHFANIDSTQSVCKWRYRLYDHIVGIYRFYPGYPGNWC